MKHDLIEQITVLIEEAKSKLSKTDYSDFMFELYQLIYLSSDTNI